MTDTSTYPLEAHEEHAASRDSTLATAARRPLSTRRSPKRLRIPAHHMIFDVGDPADRLFSATHASVVIYHPSRDGHKTLLDIVTPGQLFGFCNRSFHDCQALATAPTSLHVYGLGEIMTAAASSRRAFDSAVQQIDRLRRLAALRLGTTTGERLAAFLLVQTPCDAHPPIAVMPLTRRELADHLSTTVETIARNMAAMRRAGVVGKESHSEVEILDLDALKALSTGAATLNDAFARERAQVQA